LLAAVAGLYLLDRERGLGRASELVTGAGLAVTGASGLRLLAVLVGFELDAPIAPPSTLSNIALIVVALLLILAGTRFGYRGPTYVGAIGLFIFVIVLGLDLRSEDPENSIVGWPLVLLILGAIAFAVSVVPGLRIRLTLERAGGK
jgi:hypothetical protein